MKYKFYFVWLIIPFLVFVILQALQVNGTLFFYGLTQILAVFIFIAIWYFALLRCRQNKKEKNQIKRFSPMILAAALAIIGLFFAYLSNPDSGKQKVIFASATGSTTAVWIDLFKDNTFTLCNSGPFGGTYYRGTYTFNNDTLQLSNGDKNLYPTLSFVDKLDTIKDKQFFEPIPVYASDPISYELYQQKE